MASKVCKVFKEKLVKMAREERVVNKASRVIRVHKVRMVKMV